MPKKGTSEKLKRDLKLYIKLFIASFELSAFTFGGGYVIVSLMRKKFVEKFGWLSDDEMLDFTVIAQSSPGAIAINASILVGYRIAGVLGAATTILATIIPPFIIIYLISFGYTALQGNLIFQGMLKGMQAGVAAVICDVVISMAKSVLKNKIIISLIIMLSAFIAAAIFNVNVILIIFVGIFLGALLYSEKDEAVNKK